MRQHHIHRLFEVGVTLKGLHALLELSTGAAILAISPAAVSSFFLHLAFWEQSQGAPAFIANFLLNLARAVQNGSQHFAGIYLLIVGLINVGLVIGLLRGALWSYPAALAALGLLMAYQLYRYTHTHAVALILLTLFDAVVWYLVWHEYQILRAGRLPQPRLSYGNRT
jgi:uncharacterized membrane protein